MKRRSRRNTARRGVKRQVLARVFEICHERGEYVFHNDLVEEVLDNFPFSNKYDVTKIDHSSDYPDIMNQGEGYFLIHLGKGYHQFIYNQSLAYHKLEPIGADEAVIWPYVPSVLNDFDTSEANVLSIAYNQLVLHDFLYGDRRANPEVYFPRRTSRSLDYTIGSMPISANNLQMEMDLVLVKKPDVTILEAKNIFQEDFAVYQLFHPYLYYDKYRRSGRLAIGDIQCCFVQRDWIAKESVLRFHLYRFTNRDLASIELIRKKQYTLRGG